MHLVLVPIDQCGQIRSKGSVTSIIHLNSNWADAASAVITLRFRLDRIHLPINLNGLIILF